MVALSWTVCILNHKQILFGAVKFQFSTTFLKAINLYSVTTLLTHVFHLDIVSSFIMKDGQVECGLSSTSAWLCRSQDVLTDSHNSGWRGRAGEGNVPIEFCFSFSIWPWGNNFTWLNLSFDHLLKLFALCQVLISWWVEYIEVWLFLFQLLLH